MAKARLDQATVFIGFTVIFAAAIAMDLAQDNYNNNYNYNSNNPKSQLSPQQNPPQQPQQPQPQTYELDEELHICRRRPRQSYSSSDSSLLISASPANNVSGPPGPADNVIFDVSIWYNQELKHLLQITVSLGYGLVIGYLRQQKQYSKLSTYTLISMASCLLTIIGHNPRWYDPPHGDVYRIQAAVVQGIGFMGAGFILRVGHNVVGMTNAASVYLTAALGIGVGYGYYILTGWVVFMLVCGYVCGILRTLYKRARGIKSKKEMHTITKGNVQSTVTHGMFPAEEDDILS